MYTVMIDGRAHEFKADGMSIDNGNILFYRNQEKLEIDCVVQAGKWEYVKVHEDSDALQIRAPEKVLVPEQAGSSEEVHGAQQVSEASENLIKAIDEFSKEEPAGFDREDETEEEKIHMTEVISD